MKLLAGNDASPQPHKEPATVPVSHIDILLACGSVYTSSKRHFLFCHSSDDDCESRMKMTLQHTCLPYKCTEFVPEPNVKSIVILLKSVI